MPIPSEERYSKIDMPENTKERGVKWLAKVEKHDFLAARSYLSLLFPEGKVNSIIARLRKAPVVPFKAKDILRASQLPLLDENNPHVQMDRKKIRKGQGISPILLVRNEKVGRVVIADGYHRICAVYEFDEDEAIQCKII